MKKRGRPSIKTKTKATSSKTTKTTSSKTTKASSKIDESKETSEKTSENPQKRINGITYINSLNINLIFIYKVVAQ